MQLSQPDARRGVMLDALTGSRFFAAFAVVVVHYLHVAKWPDPLPGMGAAAVSFFFVLSGFVLTYTYARRMPQLTRRGYGEFLRARFARIYPIHLFMLLTMTAIVLPWIMADRSSHATAYQTGKLLLGWMANLTLVQSYFVDAGIQETWNGVAWSVSCELTFYCAFPVLLVLMTKKLRSGRALAWAGLGVWAVTIAALIALQLVLVHGLHRSQVTVQCIVYRQPFLRISDFAIGALTGLWYVRAGATAWTHRPSREAATVAGVVGLVVVSALANGVWKPLSLSVLYVPAAALLIAAVSSGPTLLGRAMAWSPFVMLGEASYSLYLSHYIPLKLIEHYVGTPTAGQTVLAIVACVPFSVLLYRFVEDPCRRLLRAPTTARPTTALAASDAANGSVSSPAPATA